MAWVAPRTWTDGEVVTAAIFNQDLRDNQSILKVPITDIGRVIAFDSAYFADLDGTSITGLVDPSIGNLFTAGTHDFSAVLLKVPVGTDKYGGTSGDKDTGSIWVEGDYLHHVDDSQDEWRYLGNLISAAGAQPGFVFIAGNGLRYTDADGDIRECVSSLSIHNDSAATPSLWSETYLHWIREAEDLEYQGHSDIIHTDASPHTDQTDHNDSGPPHSDHDDHDDTTNPHGDFNDYVDHTDGAHVDFPFHSDFTDHTDHQDHDDVSHSDHNDHNDFSDHSDVPADQRPEFIGGV